MFEILSTRELALGIYIVLIIIWIFSKQSIRSATINVIKCACTRQILIPFLLMLSYALIFIYLLSFFDFWEWKHLKDAIIWFIFAGVPSCFNAVGKNLEDHYFRHIFTCNFKFAALAEFFLGTFTFSLPAELVLQLALFFLFAMQAVAARDAKYKQVKVLLDWIIALLSVLILYFTVKKAITTYSELGAIDTFVSFFIPILFSALYVPVAYFFAVYAKYQTLFVRMNFKSPRDKKIRFKHKLQIIFICKLSYTKVCRFERDYVNGLYVRMSEDDFNSLIADFSKKS